MSLLQCVLRNVTGARRPPVARADVGQCGGPAFDVVDRFEDVTDKDCRVLLHLGHGFSLAKDTIPEGRFETLFRDYIHSASEPILQEILHRNEIDQTELDVRGDINENVYVAVGASCVADDRTEKSERCESTLAQLTLERSEFYENYILHGHLTVRSRESRRFAL